MTGLSQLLNSLTGDLNLGTEQQRTSIRQAVAQVCQRQGYQAKVASFKDGILTLHARPAETYLLRMDEGNVREALNNAGVGDAVQEIRIFSRI